MLQGVLMKVDTMRKIDFWLGVPLTFIMTGIVWFFKLFKRPHNTIHKILFIELSEMGSTILVDPAMRKAKQHFNAELFFLIFSKNKVSLDILKTVPSKNIFTLREHNLLTLIWDTLRYFFWCRKHKFSATVDLELFSRVTALLTGMSGAYYKVGFHRFHNEGLYRGNMLTHKVAYNAHMHIAKNFIALINALIDNDQQIPYSKTKIDDQEIVLTQATSSDDAKNVIHQKIQTLDATYDPKKHPILLINPNASELLPQRRWMPEHYCQLIKLVLEHHSNYRILITGAPAEHEQAQQLVTSVNHPQCINFAGHVKFHQLIDLYNVSHAMVTNDSGPGHFSSVTPLKTFVIFGPETPALYGSLGNSTPIYAGLACSPCVSASNHRKTPCSNNVCLQMITPDLVYQTIKKSL